jgi:sodium-dependent phosphate cotransporter
MLQIIVKGAAARILRKVVGFNGYLNIIIGMFITIMVQSSSITTSTLTPLAAVGLIGLEDMLPLTLGANIGTTLTGIMAATVVTSNPVQAWQVALCHLFFNIFGIVLWYPIPRVREIPLNGARFLGKMTTNPKWGKIFPLAYTFVVFFIIPGIAYGITAASSS